ncbi:Potassium channel subfamily K member 4 [Apostichopus japonicus]|uniref:Potassium channel subfamily K member 4 n=1 Tax=Stichopus japonicus TaxID=307972 RepID=A0A2G8KVU1_STIJA|nr:Potassium channel subfamily K member 4 [Apostichopus japonicus]
MDTPEEKSSFLNIKNWQWSILLFLLLLVYLVFGAFIFRATENGSSAKAQNELYLGLYDFMLAHTCIHPYDLELFANNITTYLSKGATLKKAYWIDRDTEDTETRWTMTRAFVFSLTIITTIGYGNIVPRSGRGRLFCVAYALVGIPIMAFTLSVFGKSLDGFVKRYTKLLKFLGRPIKHKWSRVAVQSLITILLIASTLILVPATLLSYFEQFSYFDAIYFFFITVSTIGFGDIVLDECTRCSYSYTVWIFVLLYTIYVFLGICVISALFKAFSSYRERKLIEAESKLVTFITSGSTTIINTLATTFVTSSPSHSAAKSTDDSIADSNSMEMLSYYHDTSTYLQSTCNENKTSADVHGPSASTYPYLNVNTEPPNETK